MVAPVAVREVKVGKTPVVATETTAKEQASHSVSATADAPKHNVQPVAKPAVATPKRPYHIIIASVSTEKDAEKGQKKTGCNAAGLCKRIYSLFCQLFLIKSVPHFGQWMLIRPLPLGTRTFCLQFGQR